MDYYENIMESIYKMGERAGVKAKRSAWKVAGIVVLSVAVIVFGLTMLLRGFHNGVKKKG